MITLTLRQLIAGLQATSPSPVLDILLQFEAAIEEHHSWPGAPTTYSATVVARLPDTNGVYFCGGRVDTRARAEQDLEALQCAAEAYVFARGIGCTWAQPSQEDSAP